MEQVHAFIAALDGYLDELRELLPPVQSDTRPLELTLSMPSSAAAAQAFTLLQRHLHSLTRGQVRLVMAPTEPDVASPPAPPTEAVD